MFYHYDEPIDVIYKDLLKAFDASLDCILKEWEGALYLERYRDYDGYQAYQNSLSAKDVEADEIKEQLLVDRVDFIVDGLYNLLDTAFVSNDKKVIEFIKELRSTYKRKGFSLKKMVVLDPDAFKEYFGKIADEMLFFAFLFFKSWLYQLDNEDAYELLIIICDQLLSYSFKFNEREMDIQMVRELNGRLYYLYKELRDDYQHKLFLSLNRKNPNHKGRPAHREIKNNTQDIRFNNLKAVWDVKRKGLLPGLINKLKDEGYIVGEHLLMRSINKFIPKYKWTEDKGNVKLNALVSVLLKEKLINGSGDDLEAAFRNTFDIKYSYLAFFKNADKRIANGHPCFTDMVAIVKQITG